MALWGARVWSPWSTLITVCASRQLGVNPLIEPWKEPFGGAWRPLVVAPETAPLGLQKCLERVLDILIVL